MSAGSSSLNGDFAAMIEPLENVVAELRRQLRAASADAQVRERRISRQLTAQLNQSARRLLHAGRNADWAAALAEAAAEFCPRAAVFTVRPPKLRLEHAQPDCAAFVISLDQAPAIAECVESREPIIAAWTRAELSTEIVQAFGELSGARAYLFPLASGVRTVALLLAQGARDAVDTDALELIAALGAAAWGLRALAEPVVLPLPEPARPAAPQLVSIQPAPAPVPAPAAAPAAAAALSAAVVPTAVSMAPAVEPDAAERDLHYRAQRFARVQVAELRLYKSEEVKLGRSVGKLYEALREQIDRCREQFRTEFLERSGSMTDYFHEELVRTLANQDAALLGAAYPGPLEPSRRGKESAVESDHDRKAS